MTDDHDPGVDPEEEGIPDLQDGSPQAEQASDPQRMPVPGDEPVAVEDFGTTFSEQVEGAPLEERLAEEESEVDETVTEGPATREAGQLSDDPLPERPANQDVFAQETPAQGLPAEETATHIADDDRQDLDLTGLAEETREVAEDGADVTEDEAGPQVADEER